MMHGVKYIAIATLLQLKYIIHFLHEMRLGFVYWEIAKRSAVCRLDTLFGSSVSDRPVAVASLVLYRFYRSEKEY
jgi:hypothetical protein